MTLGNAAGPPIGGPVSFQFSARESERKALPHGPNDPRGKEGFAQVGGKEGKDAEAERRAESGTQEEHQMRRAEKVDDPHRRAHQRDKPAVTPPEFETS